MGRSPGGWTQRSMSDSDPAGHCISTVRLPIWVPGSWGVVLATTAMQAIAMNPATSAKSRSMYAQKKPLEFFTAKPPCKFTQPVHQQHSEQIGGEGEDDVAEGVGQGVRCHILDGCDCQ